MPQTMGQILSILIAEHFLPGGVSKRFNADRLARSRLNRYLHCKMWQFATSPASAFSATKSGRFATARKGMLPQNTKAYSATATFILGRPSTPILSWLFPGWSAIAAKHTRKPSSRLSGRIQLTTDGHGPYLSAVKKMFGGAIDYAMLVKIYESQGETRSAKVQSCRFR